MYLYQMGTDQLEKCFGSVRTITHARNCDALELNQRLQHAESINEIIAKYPTWKRFHGKRLGSYTDASSQVDWSGDLNVDNIDFYQQWTLGRIEAVKILDVELSYFTPAQGYSMPRPNKRLVGVTADTDREEVDESVVDEISEGTDSNEKSEDAAQTNTEDNEVSPDIEEFIENYEIPFSSTVDVDGKQKHKSSVVRELFNESGFSADRLRRVRAYIKFVSSDNEDVQEELELDDMIMIGDTVCAKVPLKDGSACFTIGKIASMRNVTDKKFKTVAPSAKIIDLQLQVKICQANIADNMLKVTNSTADGLTTWSGTHCASLSLTDMSIDTSKAVSIMSSLPLVDTQSTQLSLLPYHPSLAVTVQTGDATTKVPCRLCEERVETKVMRKHAGKHILKDNLGIVCGFCGLGTCSIDLVKRISKRKNSYLRSRQ